MITNVYLMYRGVNHVRLAGFKGMIARLPNYKVIIDAGKETHDSPESINDYLQDLIGNCDIAALFLGKEEGSGRYINQEIAITRNWNIQRVVFRTPGTNEQVPYEWKQMQVAAHFGEPVSIMNALNSL